MDKASLQSNLRYLIASTSMELVHSSLTQIMKEDYEFLRKVYSAAASAPAPTSATPAVATATVAEVATPAVKKAVFKKAAPAPAPAPAPPTITAPAAEVQEPPRIRADTKVRIVKNPTAPEDLIGTTSHAPAPASLTGQAALATLPQEPAFVHTESGLRDPKEQKKWQKEQEDKKMRELSESGVNPASLLTEANLRKWVVDEKKTFAAIAREYVGLSDSVIAAEAKKYGLQSDTSKRRAMIAANKARS